MHDPQIVYLSAKLLANRAGNGEKLEGFKEIARQTANDYGEKLLPRGDQYMEILDFLLEVENRAKNRNTIRRVSSLLGNGEIEEAYKIIKSFDVLVRMRGEDLSSNTTSSIRTPPKRGI